MEDRTDEKRELLEKIFKYAGVYKKRLIVAVFFSTFTGVTYSIKPLIIKDVIDQGISNTALEPMERLSVAGSLCLLYVVVHLLNMILWAVGYRNLLVGIEGFLFNIRSSFFHHVQNLCMRFYDKTASGELFNYIMGSPMANLKRFLSTFALSIPYQSVALVINLIALITYDWLLTSIMLLMILVSIFMNRITRKKVKMLSTDMLRSESEASKYIDDVLHGSRAVKMYAIEDSIFKNFEDHLETLKDKGIKLSFTTWVAQARPDNVSEMHIQNAMEDLMKTHTVIMIAHRLSTVRNVDKIYVFDRGKIVQEGNYEELSHCEGFFKTMLDSSI